MNDHLDTIAGYLEEHRGSSRAGRRGRARKPAGAARGA